MSPALTNNSRLLSWVDSTARRVQADRVHWCDGSEAEREELIRTMLASGDLIELNQERWPGCYLHRSNPNDVARTENLTFICSPSKEDAGPTNNWMSPEEAHRRVGGLFEGCMKGRTMYVVPYVMGPIGAPSAKFGIEITDSPYVAVSMGTMTRMGQAALDHLGMGEDIVYGLHSIGDLNPERRFIAHLPAERLIMSFGSGYGGNALLGKKCHALRLASVAAREEGWMAEHMLILGIDDPQGETTYVAAAFPSACGKTNLAMLVPPESQKGYRIRTVGDDIAWMRPGPDGRLYAINPEAGFFGVMPGTSTKTNPNAMATLRRNTIFTNVAQTPEGDPWWEGMDGPPPASATGWNGEPWRPVPNGPKGAHPNSRFTAPARQCPCISPEWENPAGVPISAILFGSRRSRLVPLVYEPYSWDHGVYVGAMMASETTAAATGEIGVVRRDPMAMLPFCGYNMADYWGHWIEMGRRHPAVPRIFRVNWFRTDGRKHFLWPGYGENIRVLRWVLDRVKGRAGAVDTAIGRLPEPGGVDFGGLDLTPEVKEDLFRIERKVWLAEMPGREEFMNSFGGRVPAELWREHNALKARLEAM